jgi:hypothetical protein
METVTIAYPVEQEPDGEWSPLTWPYAYLFYDAHRVPWGSGVGLSDGDLPGSAFRGLPPARA